MTRPPRGTGRGGEHRPGGKFLGYRVNGLPTPAGVRHRGPVPRGGRGHHEWPHRYLSRITVDERTVICVLTHDPKFDVPLL